MVNPKIPAADLHSNLNLVDSRVCLANTIQVEHHAELRTFKSLTMSEIGAAAAEHNFWIVSRMGGSQLEFTRLAKA